jgi:hypothetical protein
MLRSQPHRRADSHPSAFTEHGAIRQLMAPSTPPKRGIGFTADITPTK